MMFPPLPISYSQSGAIELTLAFLRLLERIDHRQPVLRLGSLLLLLHQTGRQLGCHTGHFSLPRPLVS
jgi:hypothetical protein